MTNLVSKGNYTSLAPNKSIIRNDQGGARLADDFIHSVLARRPTNLL